jgi:RNA polymerase sigma-70 factor (ECF subfamily)
MTSELADHDWTAMAERHRRELQVHCYRMLGSYEDSEDLVQETLLRAWRRRDSFEGRSTFRAWLYRIATNACLDAIEQRRRRVTRSEAGRGEIPWLQPYPDQLLEGIAPSDEEPDAAVVSKETIELTFMVAIQHLTPRQRAVLILRDVLGWSAKETASLLEVSVAAVNSALQRARATLKEHLPARRLEWAPGTDPSERERALIQRYVEVTEENDTDGLVELLAEDLRFSMPPEPGLFVGRDVVVKAWIDGGYGSPSFGDMRCVVTRANMQPAVAIYVRRPGDAEHRAMAIDVLRIEGGAVAEITTFVAGVFPAFGLPPTL